MANTIRDGFAARPSLEGDPHTLNKKRARTSSQVARDDSSGSSHKTSRTMVREACTTQVVVASPRQSEGEEDEEVSLLDPTDTFLDPEQAEAAVTTVSTLDRATAEVEEPKLRLDRELCPSNAPSISAKKVNPSLFNKRGGLWRPSGVMTFNFSRSKR